jgi:hypothetical protein
MTTVSRVVPSAPFVQGDLVVFVGQKPVLLSSRRRDNTRGIVSGTILRCETRGGLGVEERSGYVTAVVAGGAVPDVLGSVVLVKPSQVVLFDGTYVAKGSRVRVTGKVVFRKKSLCGKEGVVVLPTDEDEDIGVQFDEHINAGSLDGAGAEGHCVYLPATAVKNLSE